MPAQNHVHKYKRNKLGPRYTVYECVLPDCTHYLPESRIVGKKCICWVCGKPTVVFRDSNGILAKPHCQSTCTKVVNNGRKKEKDVMEMFDLPPLNIPNILP